MTRYTASSSPTIVQGSMSTDILGDIKSLHFLHGNGAGQGSFYGFPTMLTFSRWTKDAPSLLSSQAGLS